MAKRHNLRTTEYQEPARHLRNPYVTGSAAPRFSSPEEQEKFESPREREQRVKREREARILAHKRQNYMRKNRVSAVYMILAVLVASGILASYVKLQSDITISLKKIASLQNQLESIKADNDATEKRLATAVSLDEVKNSATLDLGMNYADDTQIVYFEVENTDFMSQYSDLP